MHAVQQIAEQLDSIPERWNQTSLYASSHDSLLTFIDAETYSPIYALSDLADTYGIRVPPNRLNHPIYIVMCKKTISFSSIQKEQVYFICFTSIRQQIYHAYTSRIYDLSTI